MWDIPPSSILLLSSVRIYIDRQRGYGSANNRSLLSNGTYRKSQSVQLSSKRDSKKTDYSVVPRINQNMKNLFPDGTAGTVTLEDSTKVVRQRYGC